jgi:hypothetical protein
VDRGRLAALPRGERRHRRDARPRRGGRPLPGAAHPRRRRRARRPRRRMGRAPAADRRVLAAGAGQGRGPPRTGPAQAVAQPAAPQLSQAEALYRELRPQADPRSIAILAATAYRCCGRPRRITDVRQFPHPRERPAGCP